MRAYFREFQEQFLLVLETLDFRATLDILLLAAAFLVIYRTFRPSGGLKIFGALAAGTALFMLSRLLHFRALNWIFENFRDVIIILLVVVFQPEIRRLFERVVSLRGRRLFLEDTGFAGDFARTVFQLAARKNGALFVLPGAENVNALTTGGFPAKANYSGALVQSIFDPHSPGHDGAVLLEGDRIQAFGLRLPLSETGVLPEDLGTRHHAAMGLAEKSDALVIAVSEERGTVTYFQNGRYRVVRNPAELESLVRSFYFRERRMPRFQRMTRLAPQFLASLALAFLFWAGVVFSEGRIRMAVVSGAVEFANRPGGLVLADTRAPTVTLRVSGTREKLKLLEKDSIKVRLNLTGLGPGQHFLAIKSAAVDLPDGVGFLAAQPAGLNVSLIAITEQSARVEPRFTGRLPEHLELLVSEIEPETVPVYFSRDSAGASPQTSVPTVPIDISGIRRGTELRAKLAPPADLRPVEGEWPQVRVRIEIHNKPGVPGPDDDEGEPAVELPPVLPGN